jgi:bifunctional non-homologous end joining protein LigD
MPGGTNTDIKQLIKSLQKYGAVKEAFPHRLSPMLATKIKAPFDDEDHIFEVKWDGYRIIAYKQKKTVKLYSREFQDFTTVYSSITDSLVHLPVDCVLDGEAVMLDSEGRPSFDELQRVKSSGTSRLAYCIFDVLWIDGYSLLNVPLIHRKKILERLLAKSRPHLFYYGYTEKNGKALFREMEEQGLEGIVGKRKDSLYIPGKRTSHWLKIQTRMRQEFVIGGWTESESGRPFRSLIFGYYENGKLIYFGHSGGGYTDKNALMIKKKLDKIPSKKNPFSGEVESSTPAHWVKPLLVGEFEYATLTRSGKIRKPAIFKGLRNDKDPKKIILEKPVEHGEPKKITKPAPSANSNWHELKEALSRGSVNELEADGKPIELNDIERTLWSSYNITKAELIRYYISMSEYILPYLRNRPLSLHIKHNGVNAPGMYIKGMEGQQPEWARTFTVKRKHLKAGKPSMIDYIICNDTATLIYLVNLGCIDLNPWNSRAEKPLCPDYFVIDLDPTGGPFEEVTEAALVARKVLTKLKIEALPKTSGKTGMHLFIPVNNIFSYPQARKVVGHICELVHEQIPDFTTIEDTISRRGKKLFLDDNQNDEGDTLASAYSVRPYRIPAVSAPLGWKEVNKNLSPEKFTIESMPKRISAKGDLFRQLFLSDIKNKNTTAIKNILKKWSR